MMAADRAQQNGKPTEQVDLKEGYIRIEKGRLTVHSSVPMPTKAPSRGTWEHPQPPAAEPTERAPSAPAGGSRPAER